MRLPDGVHLTYCTNIHAGESWPEVREVLARHVTAVRRAVAPDADFGVGLRLSAAAAAALAAPGEIDALRSFLRENRLYVFTINGFPYGAFHGARVKQKVYLPDWRDDARLTYSNQLAELLAALLPDGVPGSVSTLPGAFKPDVRPGDEARMAERLLAHAALLSAIEARTGKHIMLALEPEPCCHLETVAETIAFFERWLGQARRHIGVCFDACHMAVEYEEPAAALAALAAAGITVAKVQVSAGLVVEHAGGAAELAALGRFAEDVYLHQVVERAGGGELRRWVDLPEALAEAAAAAPGVAREWRVHFHVPLHRERLGAFRSTQAYLADTLRAVKHSGVCRQLEVETYTWDVLPPEHRGVGDASGLAGVDSDIAHELRWVIETWNAA